MARLLDSEKSTRYVSEPPISEFLPVWNVLGDGGLIN